MIIRTKKPDSFFYIVDKSLSEDKNLSWAARGLLVFLLGKPDNWSVNVEYLITQGDLKRDALHKLLNELIAAGYIKREKIRVNGKLSGVNYTVYDKPCTDLPCTDLPCTDLPCTDLPCTDLPCTDLPCTAKPQLISIDTKQVLNETSIDTKQGMNNKSADAQKTTKVGLKDLLALGVEQQTASDWLEVRRLKRAALTQTVINLLVKESAKANISVNDAVRVCAENSWQGFKADWYFNLNKQANNKPQSPISKHGGFGQRDYSQGINEDGSF
jgi:hypothetical protein